MAKSKDDSPEDTNRRRKAKAAQKAAQGAQAPSKPAAPGLALNFIQWVAGGEAGAASESPKPDEKDHEKVETSGRPRRESLMESLSSKVPDSVHERFVKIGNKFYFPDGQDAFVREGNRLSTRSENAIVIQSMVALARAESQNGVIKVGGTDFFKKEAWFAASLVGLDVKGYEPTEFERERLVRAMASRRGAPLEPDDSRERPGEPAVTTETGKQQPAAQSELMVGRLVDYGQAPFNHNPREDMSYFVRIETDRGDRDIWGKDLERAFRHSLSTPGIGDEVGIRALGKEPVTVLAAKRDAEGHEIGREELHTHRNQWSVERKCFLDERQKMVAVFRDAAITAAEGARRFPELEGSYFQLQMGQVMATEQYSGGQRQQFVDHLRDYLAKSIEYGQPLEPVRLRVKEEQTLDPRIPDRDYNPTR